MTDRPNILVLMCDQLQAKAIDPDGPCRTPHLDRLAEEGVRFTRAYTPNAVCSPARASLMTGLLPHNHGVLQVTHTTDADQNLLRTDRPHWAQRLAAAGWRTGYFGKWHVERTEQLAPFGWMEQGVPGDETFQAMRKQLGAERSSKGEMVLEGYIRNPEGYRPALLYGVTAVKPEQRSMGIITALAERFLDSSMQGNEPWCCFVSVPEPHDPFVCGAEAFASYPPESIELSPSADDELAGRPGLYRKSARAYCSLTERQRKEAAACYYASITEIDAMFGRLLAKLRDAGELERTIVVLTSDHGELLGAHGLYTKNISAAEEVYRIPLIVAGPGIARGAAAEARVGLHELGPTLLELVGCEPIDVPDSRSFAAVLRDPRQAGAYQSGYAEYHGGRVLLTQRIVWDGSWKYVMNGFDDDELYQLDEDPYERHNRIDDPACNKVLRSMTRQLWERIRATGDGSLENSHYPPLRLVSYGPLL